MNNALLRVLVLGAGLIGGAAQADTFQPTATGNGELVLYVKNNTTNAVYARGLGIRIDDVLSAATMAGITYNPVPQSPVVTFNYQLPTLAPDANLTSFLNAGSASGFSWTIMAAHN